MSLENPSEKELKGIFNFFKKQEEKQNYIKKNPDIRQLLEVLFVIFLSSALAILAFFTYEYIYQSLPDKFSLYMIPGLILLGISFHLVIFIISSIVIVTTGEYRQGEEKAYSELYEQSYMLETQDEGGTIFDMYLLASIIFFLLCICLLSSYFFITKATTI